MVTATLHPDRPADLFDRTWEWEALARFALDPRPGATLGVVSGRRRQGKSYLLQALCEATGGLYVEAVESTAAEALDLLGRRVAAFAGAPGRVAFDSWDAAVEGLLALGRREQPLLVVLDEFPYLSRSAPELPSLLQAAFGPRRGARLASRVRLVLCGSALAVMGRLLSGQAPLRGRASLELIVQAFDYRAAAEFWGVASDPALALRVGAVVGGTPAYRREFAGDDVPADATDFDAWVVRTVLNPALPLLREGRNLLAEEPDLRETALYASALAAMAGGAETRSAIASRIGRTANDLSHPLAVLEDAGFVVRAEDAFRRGRPTYRIAEPFLRFSSAVIRPRWAELSRPGRTARAWEAARAQFASGVLGPHVERVAREWTAEVASQATLGGEVARVATAVVNDRAGRAQHELDVVARDLDGRVLLLGEVKAGRRLGLDALERLRRVRDLLGAHRDLDVGGARLACIAPAFEPDLRAAAAADPAVVLVDFARLYRGD